LRKKKVIYQINTPEKAEEEKRIQEEIERKA